MEYIDVLIYGYMDVEYEYMNVNINMYLLLENR